MLMFLGGMIATDLVRTLRRVPRQSAIAPWVGVGASVALVVYVLVPRVPVINARAMLHSSWMAYQAPCELEQLVDGAISQRAADPADLTLEWANRELGAVPALPAPSDAPGGFAVARTAAGFEVRTYELSGREWVYYINLPPTR
jgi:hypothetical protein